MVRAEVASDFFVEATSSHYMKGWKGEVPQYLFDRHGPQGTGFLKELPEDAILTKDEVEEKPTNTIKPKK